MTVGSVSCKFDPVRSAVVAVGGNALIGPGESGTIPEEFAHARAIARDVAGMIAAGWSVVLTHGNGPQVGFILRRSDITAEVAPELPSLGLDYCVAETQGGIGYMLSTALGNELRRHGLPPNVVTVTTHTLVAADDPAFELPTKPIGSFYTKAQAEHHQRRHGLTVVEDAGRGYRRVVASPRPLRIVESGAVATLVRQGFTVIAVGGGGVPVVEEDGQLRGVEAVIDKDLASALLAADLRADLLVLCTAVAQVALNFGRPDQVLLDRMSADEAEANLAAGQFPPGSMGPKIEAALSFLGGGGKEVLITSTEQLEDALEGRTGTRVVATAASHTRRR